MLPWHVESFWPMDWTCVSCTGRLILYPWATRKASLFLLLVFYPVFSPFLYLTLRIFEWRTPSKAFFRWLLNFIRVRWVVWKTSESTQIIGGKNICKGNFRWFLKWTIWMGKRFTFLRSSMKFNQLKYDWFVKGSLFSPETYFENFVLVCGL